MVFHVSPDAEIWWSARSASITPGWVMRVSMAPNHAAYGGHLNLDVFLTQVDRVQASAQPLHDHDLTRVQ